MHPVLRPSDEGPRCPVCACEVGEDLVPCPRCGALHHPDCWAYAGGCAIFGCDADRWKALGEGAVDAFARRVAWWRRLSMLQWGCLVVVLSGLLLGIVLSWAWWTPPDDGLLKAFEAGLVPVGLGLLGYALLLLPLWRLRRTIEADGGPRLLPRGPATRALTRRLSLAPWTVGSWLAAPLLALVPVVYVNLAWLTAFDGVFDATPLLVVILCFSVPAVVLAFLLGHGLRARAACLRTLRNRVLASIETKKPEA